MTALHMFSRCPRSSQQSERPNGLAHTTEHVTPSPLASAGRGNACFLSTALERHVYIISPVRSLVRFGDFPRLTQRRPTGRRGRLKHLSSRMSRSGYAVAVKQGLRRPGFRGIILASPNNFKIFIHGSIFSDCISWLPPSRARTRDDRPRAEC